MSKLGILQEFGTFAEINKQQCDDLRTKIGDVSSSGNLWHKPPKASMNQSNKVAIDNLSKFLLLLNEIVNLVSAEQHDNPAVVYDTSQKLTKLCVSIRNLTLSCMNASAACCLLDDLAKNCSVLPAEVKTKAHELKENTFNNLLSNIGALQSVTVCCIGDAKLLVIMATYEVQDAYTAIDEFRKRTLIDVITAILSLRDSWKPIWTSIQGEFSRLSVAYTPYRTELLCKASSVYWWIEGGYFLCKHVATQLSIASQRHDATAPPTLADGSGLINIIVAVQSLREVIIKLRDTFPRIVEIMEPMNFLGNIPSRVVAAREIIGTLDVSTIDLDSQLLQAFIKVTDAPRQGTGSPPPPTSPTHKHAGRPRSYNYEAMSAAEPTYEESASFAAYDAISVPATAKAADTPAPAPDTWETRHAMLLCRAAYEACATSVTSLLGESTHDFISCTVSGADASGGRIAIAVAVRGSSKKREKCTFIAFRGSDKLEEFAGRYEELLRATSIDKADSSYFRNSQCVPLNYLMDVAAKGTLVITGHSLGGACATLLATKMIRQHHYIPAAKKVIMSNVRCVVFGSPMVGRSSYGGFMAHFGSIFQNNVLSGDQVPFQLSAGPVLGAIGFFSEGAEKEENLSKLSEYALFGGVYRMLGEATSSAAGPGQLTLVPDDQCLTEIESSSAACRRLDTSNHSIGAYFSTVLALMGPSAPSKTAKDSDSAASDSDPVVQSLPSLISAHKCVLRGNRLEVHGSMMWFVASVHIMENERPVGDLITAAAVSRYIAMFIVEPSLMPQFSNEGTASIALKINCFHSDSVMATLPISLAERTAHLMPDALVSRIMPLTSLVQFDRLPEDSEAKRGFVKLAQYCKNIYANVPVEFAFCVISQTYDTTSYGKFIKQLLDRLDEVDFPPWKDVSSEVMLEVLSDGVQRLKYLSAEESEFINSAGIVDSLGALSDKALSMDDRCFEEIAIVKKDEVSNVHLITGAPRTREQFWEFIFLENISISIIIDSTMPTEIQTAMGEYRYSTETRNGRFSVTRRPAVSGLCFSLTHRKSGTSKTYSVYRFIPDKNGLLHKKDFSQIMQLLQASSIVGKIHVTSWHNVEHAVLFCVCRIASMGKYDDASPTTVAGTGPSATTSPPNTSRSNAPPSFASCKFFLANVIGRRDHQNRTIWDKASTMVDNDEIVRNVHHLVNEFYSTSEHSFFGFSEVMRQVGLSGRGASVRDKLHAHIKNLRKNVSIYSSESEPRYFCGQSTLMNVSVGQSAVQEPFIMFFPSVNSDSARSSVLSKKDLVKCSHEISDGSRFLRLLLTSAMQRSTIRLDERRRSKLEILARSGMFPGLVLKDVVLGLGNVMMAAWFRDAQYLSDARRNFVNDWHNIAHNTIMLASYEAVLQDLCKRVPRINCDFYNIIAMEDALVEEIPEQIKDVNISFYDLCNIGEAVLSGTQFDNMERRNITVIMFVLKLIYSSWVIRNTRKNFTVVTIGGKNNGGKTTLIRELFPDQLAPEDMPGPNAANVTILPRAYSNTRDKFTVYIDLPGLTDADTYDMARMVALSGNITVFLVACGTSPSDNNQIMLDAIEDIMKNKSGPGLICISQFDLALNAPPSGEESPQYYLEVMKKEADAWRRSKLLGIRSVLEPRVTPLVCEQGHEVRVEREAHHTRKHPIGCGCGCPEAVVFSGTDANGWHTSVWLTTFDRRFRKGKDKSGKNLKNKFIDQHLFAATDVQAWVEEVKRIPRGVGFTPRSAPADAPA